MAGTDGSVLIQLRVFFSSIRAIHENIPNRTKDCYRLVLFRRSFRILKSGHNLLNLPEHANYLVYYLWLCAFTFLRI
jgi:hypothetical protein